MIDYKKFQILTMIALIGSICVIVSNSVDRSNRCRDVVERSNRPPADRRRRRRDFQLSLCARGNCGPPPSPLCHARRSSDRLQTRGVWVDLDNICAPVWPRPDLRSRSRSRRFRSCKNCTFLGLAWTSKLMVGGDSMGPGLQFVGARLLNFLLGMLSWEFKHHPKSIFHRIQMAIFRYR